MVYTVTSQSFFWGEILNCCKNLESLDHKINDFLKMSKVKKLIQNIFLKSPDFYMVQLGTKIHIMAIIYFFRIL